MWLIPASLTLVILAIGGWFLFCEIKLYRYARDVECKLAEELKQQHQHARALQTPVSMTRNEWEVIDTSTGRGQWPKTS